MNVDQIFEIFNRHQVRFLLIGGMNFYLRHEPVTTLDVDLWIEDSPENRRRSEIALSDLHASWGETESAWEDVAHKPPGWLDRQSMFCLLSPAGALDVFRHVRGLDDWERSFENAIRETTPGSVRYGALCGFKSDIASRKCNIGRRTCLRSDQIAVAEGHLVRRI